jgi:hypothetical protein
MCADLVAFEEVRQWQMPYCLSLACNDVDFFLQVEVVVSRELLNGVGSEFSELHKKMLINCNRLESQMSLTWILTFRRGLVRPDEVHDTL